MDLMKQKQSMRKNYLVKTKVLNRRYANLIDFHKPVIILMGRHGVMGTSSVSSFENRCLEQTATRLYPSGGQTIHVHAHRGVDKWEHTESRKNNKPDPRILTALTPAAMDNIGPCRPNMMSNKLKQKLMFTD